jgi:acetylornithine deacetylase/succinyl-diaminopimelate desuccinylase-like protein
MDFKRCRSFVNHKWQGEVVKTLKEYVAIPNVSRSYDPEWATNGLTEKAMDLLVKWVRAQELKDATVTILQRDGCTPLLFVDVPSSNPEGDEETGVVLLYGHMDKQPPFEGWEEGLDPYNATVKDGKLYGRGAADDGYAIFCAVTSIKALQEQGCSHARCVIVLEASEESGSPDLM